MTPVGVTGVTRGRRDGTTASNMLRSCCCDRKVQSPSVSQSPRAHEDTLQRENSELKHKEVSLDKEIAQLEAEGYHIAEIDKHITLLHQYNELKDTGQMLLGRLAVLRGVTTKDLYGEFGMDLDD